MLRKWSLWPDNLRQLLTCRRSLYMFGVIIVLFLFLALWLWRNNSRCLIFELEEPNPGIVSLGFLQNSNVIIVGTMRGKVDIWDVEQRRLIKAMENREPTRVACHPDRATFATNWGDDCIRRGNVISPSEEFFYPELPHAKVIDFSPSGRLVAAGGLDAFVKVWTVSSGRVLAAFTDHTHSVNAMAFCGDRFLATGGSANDSICIWDLSTKKLLTTLDSHMDYVNQLFFLNDSTLLSMGSDRKRSPSIQTKGTIRIWDISTGDCKHSISTNCAVSTGVLSPDKNRFFVGCANGMLLTGESHTLHITHCLSAHRGYISALALSSDGMVLASASDDLTRPSIIRFWDVNSMCRVK
jgi:WD40 repeat protein